MTHQCPGPLCEAHVDPSMLMCPAHWYQVPKPIRAAVWRTWRRGAGAGTPAHRAAMAAAIRTLPAAAAEPTLSPSLKHPACGSAVESQPQAGPRLPSAQEGTDEHH
jgi:hypothetical protein